MIDTQAIPQLEHGPVERPPCHILDDQDRPLCFGPPTGNPVHTLALCRDEGHAVCSTCERIYRVQQAPGTGTMSNVTHT